MTVETVDRRINGLIVVVINRHPKFLLHSRRLAGYLAVDENIPIYDLHRFAGKTDHPLDIIYLRFYRGIEYRNVPALGFKELVYAFKNKYPVPPDHGHLLGALPIIPAAWTTWLSRLDRNIVLWTPVPGNPVSTTEKIVIVSISALTAPKSEMSAPESIGHTSRRDRIGPHSKNKKDKSYRNCEYNPIDRVENTFDQWIVVFLILCLSLWQLFPGLV
jgi:hypothetical protein